MKGLLLAGGHGTRLRPLTFTGNKHMLPIANKPMILYGLEHLRNGGIKEVGVILGPISEGVKDLIGDGSKFGLDVSYIEQPEPKGLAHAVMISEDFMKRESFIMYLGDNLLKEGVVRFKEKFESRELDCVIGVCPTKDPSRFGVVELTDGRVTKLVEKPKEPKSNLALVGVYVFSASIFEAVKTISPSSRNELEITDAIQKLVSTGKKVESEQVAGWWKDTGKPEDLLEANQLVLSDIETSVKADFISEQTQMMGKVAIGLGSKLVGAVNIRGPVIIGKNCTIGPNTYIGPYTSVGDDCVLRDTEIENSIIMNNVEMEAKRRIVDSLVASHCKILSSDRTLPKGYKLVIGEKSFVQI